MSAELVVATQPDALPPIDVVILSHDHYDHLDSATVHRLAARYPEARWLSPLRIGRFLRARGADAVTEMDWWEELTMHGVRFACTPAQHHSARGIRDRRAPRNVPRRSSRCESWRRRALPS